MWPVSCKDHICFKRFEMWRDYFGVVEYTRKRSKVEPLDGHISTTKKDNKLLWLNSVSLLS